MTFGGLASMAGGWWHHPLNEGCWEQTGVWKHGEESKAELCSDPGKEALRNPSRNI